MTAEQRRSRISARLHEAHQPISATALAKELGVSHQIIVGDVALLRAVLLAAGALLAVFFFLFLPFYGTDTVRAAPEFAWAYWPCLVWAWAFAVPVFWAMVPAWRVCGSIAVKGMAFTGKNARDLRTVSRLAFADAVIFPAGMLIVAYLGAGSAPLTLLITPLVTFCCLAAGIVLYVLSRLVADAAALREDNDLTI